MSENSVESKNVFKYKPTDDGCCDIYMESTDTEDIIKFPGEIDGLRVTAIGYRGVAGCKNVKVVIIPEGVTRIKSSAFVDCPNLVRIHIPTTLERVNSFTLRNLFCGNSAALLTCCKDRPRSWEFEERYLPPKSVLIPKDTGCRRGRRRRHCRYLHGMAH